MTPKRNFLSICGIVLGAGSFAQALTVSAVWRT
jgi:hypothetical protein